MTFRLKIFIFVLIFGFNLLSYSDTIHAQPTEKGGFVSIELQISSVNKGHGFILGILGGYQTEDGFILGAGIYDLLNGTPFPDGKEKVTKITRRTKMHFGGVLIGYENNSSANLKLRGSTIIGIGDVSTYTGKKKDSTDGSYYFIAQPFLSLKFGEDQKVYPLINSGWRFHSGVNTPGTTDWTLGGPFLGISGTYGSL